VAPGEVLRRVRRSTGAFQLKPEFSAPYLLGGVDVAVDAVGSKQSLETSLHATRAGGRVVLSGMPAAADLSAAWFRELEIVGTYASAQHEESFRIATELAATDAVQQLAKNVATYPLHRWREALDHAHSAGRLGTVKVAFDPRSTR
jgi:threonine dehydrogenase-like Zn-dependent dehydrogenase